MRKLSRFVRAMATLVAATSSVLALPIITIDRFVAYYNDVRPHRACNRATPRSAFDARAKAGPALGPLRIPDGVRVRTDRVSKAGNVTIRYRTKLHHIGIGHAHIGKDVLLLVDGLDIRVITRHGELLRRLTLDPSKDYQARGVPFGPPPGRKRNSKVRTTL